MGYTKRGGVHDDSVRLSYGQRYYSATGYRCDDSPISGSQFTKMLAKEIGNRGITVNTVAPGPADTSFYYPDETEESTERYKSMSIDNRLTKVSDVVPLLAFLSTEEAGWITGQTIRINGGLAD